MRGRANGLHAHLPPNGIDQLFPKFLVLFGFAIRTFYIINSFVRLRFDHNRLVAHAFYLSLNSVSFCTRHSTTAICDFSHFFIFPIFLLFRFNLIQFYIKKKKYNLILIVFLSKNHNHSFIF